MDTSKLRQEAFDLFCKINDSFQAEISVSPIQRIARLLKLLNRSHDRFKRRRQNEDKPNGFAPSLAQPSGVLGQGTNLDGKYYEIECSECDSESCVNCGLIQGCSV